MFKNIILFSKGSFNLNTSNIRNNQKKDNLRSFNTQNINKLFKRTFMIGEDDLNNNDNHNDGNGNGNNNSDKKKGWTFFKYKFKKDKKTNGDNSNEEDTTSSNQLESTTNTDLFIDREEFIVPPQQEVNEIPLSFLINNNTSSPQIPINTTTNSQISIDNASPLPPSNSILDDILLFIQNNPRILIYILLVFGFTSILIYNRFSIVQFIRNIIQLIIGNNVVQSTRLPLVPNGPSMDDLINQRNVINQQLNELADQLEILLQISQEHHSSMLEHINYLEGILSDINAIQQNTVNASDPLINMDVLRERLNNIRRLEGTPHYRTFERIIRMMRIILRIILRR